MSTLDRLDVRFVRLRLAYDVYCAVDEHLTELYQADVSDSGADFVEVVQQISKECLKELNIDKVEPPAAYLGVIQTALATALNRIKQPGSALIQAAKKISAAVRIHSADECRIGLEAMADQAWHWFQAFASDWGDGLSRARLAQMIEVGPATLDIRVGEKDFTYCHYLKEQNQIRLLAGAGRSGLDLLFDLPFYFLHEYVSHAYALWDDDRWRFSEAYLLRAAHHFVSEEFRQKDRARRPFLGMNFDALRAKCDPNSESDLKKAEDCFDELLDLVGVPFITHLTEWATFSPEIAKRDQYGKLLSGFHPLSRDPDTVIAAFGSAYPGFNAVHQRLGANVDAILNIRNKST